MAENSDASTQKHKPQELPAPGAQGTSQQAPQPDPATHPAKSQAEPDGMSAYERARLKLIESSGREMSAYEKTSMFWTRLATGLSFLSVVVIVGGFYYTHSQLKLASDQLNLTSKQIVDAKEAFQANTIYGLEKDFADRFTVVRKREFVGCFIDPSPDANVGLCLDNDDRAQFYGILSFIRMLMKLEEKHAIPQEDVNAQIGLACQYLGSSGGRATTDSFVNQGWVASEVAARISKQCGRPG